MLDKNESLPLSHYPFFSLYFVYILVCKDGSFYTGFTPNLILRLKKHNKKQGAKYTKSRLPVFLVYHEVFLKKSEALKREYGIKQLSRSQKLALITHQNVCLTSLKLSQKNKRENTISVK